ncbi:MAG TPA: hypothetical protein VIA06_03895 [Candidatus Dormibacteraeota bacterium]|jgi:hypothetical protein|nr:hypothetical protein [Candidatus Dormibacteraeota bacterium]
MRTAADLPEPIRDLIVAGRDAWRERDYPRAEDLLGRALAEAQRTRSAFGESAALHFLGNVAFNRCHDTEARRLHLAALSISRAEGDDQGIASSLGSLALIDAAEGDRPLAATRFDEAFAAYERAMMPEAAESLRRTARALSGGTPLDRIVHRQSDGRRC